MMPCLSCISTRHRRGQAGLYPASKADLEGMNAAFCSVIPMISCIFVSFLFHHDHGYKQESDKIHTLAPTEEEQECRQRIPGRRRLQRGLARSTGHGKRTRCRRTSRHILKKTLNHLTPKHPKPLLSLGCLFLTLHSHASTGQKPRLSRTRTAPIVRSNQA